jgi:hypothetical protein
MLDVFVVAILIVAMKSASVAEIHIGPASTFLLSLSSRLNSHRASLRDCSSERKQAPLEGATNDPGAKEPRRIETPWLPADRRSPAPA